MTNPKRYDIGSGHLRESKDGGFVKWDDYDRLNKKCAALALLHYGPAGEPRMRPLPHPDWRSGKVQDEPRGDWQVRVSEVPPPAFVESDPSALQARGVPGHSFTPGPALCPHPLDAHSRTADGLLYCAACGSSLNRPTESTAEHPDPYKRCQHDLQKPLTTIETDGPRKARCVVCLESWFIPEPIGALNRREEP